MFRYRAPVTRTLSTAEGQNSGAFSTTDWILLLVPSVVFGASFLFMAIGLEAMGPGVITFGRIAFGFMALSLVPAARVVLPRSEWPRLVVLAISWIALPLTLFPRAQQHISSAVAGMINGGTPLMVGVVATAMLRRTPGALPVIRTVLGIGLVLTFPGLLVDLPGSSFEFRPFLAVVALGVGGTGLAYVAASTLAGRVGSTRSSVITYLSTPVAILFGVVFRDDVIGSTRWIGAALTLTGAWFTSRADR